MLEPYICDDAYKSSNAGIVEIGYNIYVFDIQYQQLFTASQPIKVKFKLNGAVPKDLNGYALVLTNKLVPISSDGQRHFDWSKWYLIFFITLSFSFIVCIVAFNKASS